MKRVCFYLIVFLSLSALSGQEKETSGGKFSGLAYLDYLDIIYHHNPDIEGQNGFYFRRIYLTYDYKFDKNFSSRIRLEMNNEGNYISENAMVPFVKDAWLKYKLTDHQFILGISPPPTFAVIEKIWGYRSVEKTPLDLQRMASSRDFGLAAKGNFSTGLLKYHIMFSNGSSNKQEVDKGKSFMLSLGLYPAKEFVFEAYGEFSDYPGPYNACTYQGFLGYVSNSIRAGLQYSDQTIEVPDTANTKRRVLSGFIIGKLSDRVTALGRVDRMFDPNPAGQRVAYTPFDDTAPFVVFILGIDWTIIKNLSMIPNIQYTLYDEKEDGNTPKNDLYGKLTFYWQFK